ncbi:diphosphomevalonate decarboxylase isoform X1 [Harpegnathos saltator]|uniref:diphosphomevalonate decarboxylase isoform X1 n=1 Tax=Harpegnathos saltator TaxID=610380 RepID=UPI00058CA700|nr:diphosphomevalonate decarboxylase isoform X1 [Harpegnathos saltator]XP_011153019.1 diphosphomevalonate decarboxylase isoform X1 [Harpegnathos saltator]
MNTVTCLAPINIAVIKYWGKRDESLILPVNDSISATLDTEQLHAKTTVMISQHFKEDCIWLNERKEDIKNPRLQNCLNEIRSRSQLSGHMNDWKIHICSKNNFPTAAGLASSAAGYACLTAALTKLYKVEGDISLIARSGSGSACRSIMGGFVRWHMGMDKYGMDSLAKQIVPASHWPEMRILLIVVNSEQKKVSSTIGMKRSMETSEFMQHRIANVPEKADKMQCAIIQKNFKTFAELTMKDSNQMHAVCQDTYPPCVYMNDVSHSIVNFIHSYNDAMNDIKVAYTYDAGPNATLYLMEKDVPGIIGVLDYFFPPPENIAIEYKRGLPIKGIEPSQDLLKKLKFWKHSPGQFQYIIYTKVGDGPKYLYDPQDHLLNGQGNPIKCL